MKLSNQTYTEALRIHYESYFGIKGSKKHWTIGPVDKLHPDFYILEIPPNTKHNFWIYLTVGMSLDRVDENLIELFIYSPKQDDSVVELLTLNASYHRNKDSLNLNHTVTIGKPWIDKSKCDHGFLSLPYLDGSELENFSYNNKDIHCYWFIPITEKERDYKIQNGWDALEELFEEKQLDYVNPNRKCMLDN